MSNRSEPMVGGLKTESEWPVVLITGAARRIGAAIARHLHGRYNIVVHYNQSQTEADALVAELKQLRPGSAVALQAELSDVDALPALALQAAQEWGRLDALVNNASSFYPTPLGDISVAQYDDLMATNFRAPLFLSQAAMPYLAEVRGAIVNIVDIHAERPMGRYPVYSAAKAALASLTKGLAKDLGPLVRVNGVAPGAILWPEQNHDPEYEKTLLAKTALGRAGTPDDIAGAVAYLLGAPYVTGQILAVDGGRSLST